MAPEGTTEPYASQLPSSIDALAIRPADLRTQFGATKDDVAALETFQRAANYLSVAQIFLTVAPLNSSKELKQDDIKNRLLGHFGTCPGLTLVYAHTNLLIKQTKQRTLFVTGPGHGAPAILATLYLERTIERFYPQYKTDKEGLDAFVKAFSWPGGFPSHVNAETPGAIHEGGELGYALSVAYGSVMDSPDLLTVVVVGDGESETGPTATAWHAHKYIDWAESGAVLPILHVNGFKISERTIPGTMDDRELLSLYSGYGYQVCIVEYEDVTNPKPESDTKIQEDLFAAMRWAHAEIKKIQQAARSGKPITKPRPPMIILRSPKGWTGPRKLDGNPLVNSFRSHQVPLPKAKSDDEQFKMLQQWLDGYHPESLFDFSPDAPNVIRPEVSAIVPEADELKLGLIRDAWQGYKALDLPESWHEYGGATRKDEQSPMIATGTYLTEVIKRNPRNFRIFSPDELASNKLNGVFDVTHRNFQWDPETAHKGGRVIEMLSEHTLQGFLQGYALTGRYGVFPSYEAFLSIVDTLIIQFAKFIKVAIDDAKWRGKIPSLTYIETSTLWRQEHNGYSHQQPGLIGTLLHLPRNIVRVYLPPDANCSVSQMAHCLRSTGYVNLIVGSKTPGPNYLDPEEADAHCIAGASVWKRYSTDEGRDPDVVLASAGVEVTAETIHAAKLLQKEVPELRVRVVNVTDLLVLSQPGQHPHAMDDQGFNSIFTADKPVIFNYHSYPLELQSLLFGRGDTTRFHVHGYIEEGTTTTPFSMLRMNQCGRYDLVIDAVRACEHKVDVHALVAKYQHLNAKTAQHAERTGSDPDELAAVTLYEQ